MSALQQHATFVIEQTSMLVLEVEFNICGPPPGSGDDASTRGRWASDALAIHEATLAWLLPGKAHAEPARHPGPDRDRTPAAPLESCVALT
jgi:hypothetical protein